MLSAVVLEMTSSQGDDSQANQPNGEEALSDSTCILTSTFRHFVKNVPDIPSNSVTEALVKYFTCVTTAGQ